MIPVNSITLRLSTEEILQVISKTFLPQHKEIMMQAISNILSNDSDLSNLYKASIGIIPKLEYIKRQQVFVSISSLSSWKWDKDKMLSENMLQDDIIKATIVECRPFSESHSYSVNYDYISTDGDLKTETELVYNSYIKGFVEIFPGEDMI